MKHTLKWILTALLVVCFATAAAGCDISDLFGEVSTVPTATITPSVSTSPSETPSVEPSVEETVVPSVEPIVEETVTPTVAPSVEPTVEPTVTPTVQPTVTPTVQPTVTPTVQPTVTPTVQPTVTPTVQPTVTPTVQPTVTPTVQPTVTPTVQPTVTPTVQPTVTPTVQPTVTPTVQPTVTPTVQPTVTPTVQPTVAPTVQPTVTPTVQPTVTPTVAPSVEPTVEPTIEPTIEPTVEPLKTFNVTFTDYTVTYDGNEHVIAVSGMDRYPSATVTYTKNALTDAGSLTVTATITGEGYETLILTATLTVKPLTFTGIRFNSTDYVYNGNPHTLKATGIPTGATAVYENNTVTAAGEKKLASVTVSMKNYETLTLYAVITVVSPTVTIVAVSQERTQYLPDDPYTALVSFSDTGEVFTVEEGGAIPGLNGRITFQTESNTMNPGEYEIVAEGISSDFYNVVYVSGTLTVKEVKTDLAIGGIQIDNKGNATYNGKGVHMIGVNYISMFTNCLKSDGTYDTTVTKNGLAVLAENGCGLIRFWASVFYADSGYLYIDYQESFFNALDEIFDEAARLNIGLMPSVFFTSWFMDYYDEGYYEAWVDPANNLSKSMQYMETFTEQLIHRYANHPALFAWEFGNERNLGNDIPHWSGDNILDKPRIEIYTKVLEHWSTYIHERDPYQRLICSGDAHMRSSQYNQAVAGSWTKDTYEQHKAIVALHNSGYCHGISAHNYGGYVDGSSEEGVITSLGTPQALYTPGYLADESPQTWAEVMRLQIRVAKELNKMAYIGECGTTGNHSMAIFTTKEERAERQYQVYKAIGDAVVETGLAYALYWNYDNTATLWEDDFDAELAASNSDSLLQRGSGIEWSWNENYLKGQAALRAMKETSEALKKKYGV